MLTRRLLALILLYLIATIAFLTINARGNWDFVFWFRGTKVVGMTLVAIAVSVAHHIGPNPYQKPHFSPPSLNGL